MLETFIDVTATSHRSIVVQDLNAVDLDSAQVPVSDFVVLPGITHGRGINHLVSMFRLGRHLRTATDLWIIGADVMDGAYSPHASVVRWSIATVAEQAGLDVHVLGFSWNEHPHTKAQRAMLLASGAGVTLCARDPHSAGRLRAHGASDVRDVADIVFTLNRKAQDGPELASIAAARERGFRIAIVNASGLVDSKASQTDAYVQSIRRLLAEDFAVFLLPHVDRAPRSDVEAHRAITERLGIHERVEVFPMTSPAVVNAVLAQADVAITGRMHVAIFALRNGVPPVVISTQGKVRGLLELFELEQLCVEPDDHLSERLPHATQTLLQGVSEFTERIARLLPDVRERAARNFAQTNEGVRVS